MRSIYPEKPWRLNLGCGRDYKKGWINIDALPSCQPDLVHDLNQPLPFPDQSVIEVLAQDILEHLTKEDGLKFLTEISRVLQANGQLTLRIPNIDQIITQFDDDKEVRNQFLYGTTDQTGIFGAHKAGYTLAEIKTILLCLNLKVVEVAAETTNWLIEAHKHKTIFNQKIIWVSQTFGMGGAETFTADLLAWLNRNGWSVSAYVTHQPFLALLKSKGIRTFHLPIAIDVIGNWKGLAKALLLLVPFLVQYGWLSWRVHRQGLLLMSGYPEKIMMTLFAQLTKQPVVWIEFGPLETVFTKFFGLPKLIYYLAKKLPQVVIVPSTNTKNHLISGAHISLAKLKVISCASSIQPLKKRCQKNLLVCVSRLEEGKGQDILLSALAKVKKTTPHVKLQLVGAMTEFGRQLQHQSHKLKLDKNVEFTDYVSDVRPYLAQANLVVFPSTWPLEGFGLVMIETMACGTPVMAFKTGPAPEILADGQAGMLVNKLTADALADAIIKLLHQPTLVKKMSQAGKKRFLANYTFEKVGPQYLEVFRRALACQITNAVNISEPQK